MTELETQLLNAFGELRTMRGLMQRDNARLSGQVSRLSQQVERLSGQLRRLSR
ncbi:MbeD/MobD family mobilization/exclusion protein [Pectobacterium carotovorum]|uniref:MbeD/MobD family mobilization/exclusion protein n=1 Tax=Pectobacterium odoriferum TaxID=78398 RepID=UPI003F4E169C